MSKDDKLNALIIKDISLQFLNSLEENKEQILTLNKKKVINNKK
jgi:hypothetical protein